METTVINGMCRCCASEGAFKDIKNTYHWMGDEEIYADMLRYCFDISLETSEQDDGGICEVCITQLRNATNFKKQVLHTEQQFKKHIQNKTLFKPSIVKVELPADDLNDSDDNNDHDADDGFSVTEFEVPIKTESADEAKPKKRTAKATTSRAKKSKSDNGESSTKRPQPIRIVKIESIATTGPTEDNDTKNDDKRKIAPRTELVKHRSNIKEVLINSNATPIRRYGGIGYTCCYCEEQFSEPNELKKHTLTSHSNVADANFMKNMNMSEYVVKLDITDLKCNICNTDIDNLETLLDHLKDTHEKKIFSDIKNHIFAFKFNGDPLRCVICPNSFDKFRMLVQHMHVHYRNFVCVDCDAGFVNRNALAQHAEHHRTGAFVCSFCPKVCTTQVKKRLHERTAHTHADSMNKCGYCTATFKDYRKREAHLVEAHGIKTLTPKCQACDKVFSSRRLLNIHVKRDHLMERPHKCTECEMKFFSTTGLKNHMVKHTGLKEYQCTVCLKSFGRKKTLNSHERIHDEEKRYKCEYCGQSFVQKCSWRSHMRSKHEEIV